MYVVVTSRSGWGPGRGRGREWEGEITNRTECAVSRSLKKYKLEGVTNYNAKKRIIAGHPKL
jgi:hypothetical protein